MGCIALVRCVLVLRCGLAGVVWYQDDLFVELFHGLYLSGSIRMQPSGVNTSILRSLRLIC
jgi:hypothetical protein